MAHGNYSHKKQSPKNTHNRNANQNRKDYTNVKAVAPYNFIPLNAKVVYSQWQWDNIPGFQSYCKDKLSGEIKLTIETITPLFIRGMKNCIVDEEQKISEFCRINGKAAIPGSSLRGLTRNMLEIFSFGKFNNFEDRTLFYRGLADMSSLSKEYSKNMSSREGKSIKYKFNAGYLQKKGLDYQIIPAVKNENNVQFKRFKIENSEKKLKFTFVEKEDGTFKVFSGPIGKKKKGWLVNKPNYNTKSITIPEADIESYKLDIENKAQSDKSENLLEKCKNGNLVPCFYVLWEDTKGKERVSFGHTGFFRLAYKKSIDDHVPQVLKKTDKPDMVEAIFGDKKHHASRVYFEDAYISNHNKECYLPETKIKILLSPKPTTFQHYLEQPKGEKTGVKELKHWNDDTNIRGYKMYWHRNTQESGPYGWSDPDIKNQNLANKIEPVKPGELFHARIRFENLTPEELGAILIVLNLPENHFHKLGMGKPHGLGTVKIKASPFIKEYSEKNNPYISLFENDKWYTPIVEKDASDFIKAFDQYVIKELNENQTTIWDIERMKELLKMLACVNTEDKDWLEKTRYLEIERKIGSNSDETINEYHSRPVLPRPSKVK